jgi:hypothetical protein
MNRSNAPVLERLLIGPIVAIQHRDGTAQKVGEWRNGAWLFVRWPQREPDVL